MREQRLLSADKMAGYRPFLLQKLPHLIVQSELGQLCLSDLAPVPDLWSTRTGKQGNLF